MKKIKINFKYYWPNHNASEDFFLNLLRENYEVEVSNKPDIVFFSVFKPSESRAPQQKTLESTIAGFLNKIAPTAHAAIKTRIHKNPVYQMPKLSGDFVKVFYTGENVVPDMAKCNYAFSFQYDEEFNHPKHMRLPLYAMLSEENGRELIKNKKKIGARKKEKRKFCNFLYSATNYNRESFCLRLSKYKKVDCPGGRLNNMKPIDGDVPISNREFLAPQIKHNFLGQYKFTLAFENSSSPGYTTEKIYHPMLANSIPIYWGNPLVARDFNPKSFLNAADYKGLRDLAEAVQQVDSDPKLYAQYLEEPWFNDNVPSKYFDKERYLARLDEIVESIR